MIRVGIFTAGKSGKRIYELCQKVKEVEVIAFADNNPNLYSKNVYGTIIISPYRMKKMIDEQSIDMLLVPSDRMVSYGLREYVNQLQDLQINKYKIMPSWIVRKPEIEEEDIKVVENVIRKANFKEINQLQHLQFHVIDNCNLNCRRCQHFSNIADKNSFANFEKVRMDFVRLRELFDDINTIAILGGEPFLNPEIGRYVEMIRSLFKNSRIEIITNGILVRQLDREVVDIIRSNNCMINISYYPVLEQRIEEIVSYLDNNQIQFHIGNHIDYFSKKLLREPMELNTIELNKRYRVCRDACCTTLRDGNIYPCYLPATCFLLEKLGGMIDNSNSGINIYEDVTGIEIIERLSRTFNICRYCGKEEIFDWEQTKEVSLDDWMV